MPTQEPGRIKMKRTRTMLVAALAALAFAATSVADSKVRGTVQDSSGQGIEGAKIGLTDPKSGRGYSFKSGKDGSFYQRGVLPSVYTLKVDKEGFRSYILEEVKVQAGGERTFEIKLQS